MLTVKYYCILCSICSQVKCISCLYFFIHRQLKKLDEDSLTKQPEEVFDVLEKLGEG